MFDASHVEVGRWFAEGLVDGVRVDHPDGLYDPARYLTWLRELAGPEAWIVIEKILAVDEALEPTLPVAGTTGYDSLREVGGLFVDPTGAEALTALYESTGIDYSATPDGAARPQSGRGHRHARQRAGPAVSRHRDRRRHRASAAPRRRGGTPRSHRRVPLRLPRPGRYTVDRAGRNRGCRTTNCSNRCRSWLRLVHAAEKPMPDCSSCAARSPRSRSRIACSIATLAWSRSTKSAASRRDLVSARRNSTPVPPPGRGYGRTR